MGEPLDLTVILAARDAEHEVPVMLGSLAEQSFPGTWEVIVADNGSRDGTAAAARSFSDRLPGLRVVSVPHPPRKAGALNAALQVARGRAIVTVDADDLLAPGYLEAMARALEDHDLVGGRLDVEVLNPPHVRERRRPMQQDGLETLLRFAPVVVGAAMGVRADALRAVDGFDPELRRLSDMDLSWRMHLAGARLGFAPDAVVHYRYRGGLREIFEQERAYGEGEVALYAKHRAAGVPRRRLRSTAAAWVRMLLAVPSARTPAGRARLVTQAGANLGRLRGSLRHRVFYV